MANQAGALHRAVSARPGGRHLRAADGGAATDVWKQQVVVENKAGGSGIPATETGKAAAPDGYTVMVVSSGTFGVNPSLYPDLPYKPLVDFKPISNIFLVPLVIVAHPDFPAKTLGELIELARKEPGKLSYASAGPGTSQHLSMELFKLRAKVDIEHIPYPGQRPPRWPTCWATASS